MAWALPDCRQARPRRHGHGLRRRSPRDGRAGRGQAPLPRPGPEEGFRVRFEAEIETLRKLNHPNIVRLFGFGQQEGHLFYAMELVDGNSLEEELRRGRSFDWREVTRMGIDICRALRHAARSGHHPPRHQAGQLALGRRRPPETLRLRHCPAVRLFASDDRRQRGGDGRIHGAGAGRGAAGRRPERSV